MIDITPTPNNAQLEDICENAPNHFSSVKNENYHTKKNNDFTKVKELPKRYNKSNELKLQELLRISLREAIDITYNCKDTEVLSTSLEMTYLLVNKLLTGTTKSAESLPLSQQKPSIHISDTTKVAKKHSNTESNFTDLPLHKKPKPNEHWKSRNRVGETADKFRKYYHCNFDINTGGILCKKKISYRGHSTGTFLVMGGFTKNEQEKEVPSSCTFAMRSLILMPYK